MANSIRLDKWLWAARFFKTRALAARACELGRVQANTLLAKAGRDVKPGDHVKIRNDSGDYEIEVLQLSHARGPAAVAQTLYRETEESRERRRREAEEHKAQALSDPFFGTPRPTKRDRRVLQRVRGR